jgi:hypothetical protein
VSKKTWKNLFQRLNRTPPNDNSSTDENLDYSHHPGVDAGHTATTVLALLYQASANGEKSPEGWAAMRIRAALEQLEVSTRPERHGDA